MEIVRNQFASMTAAVSALELQPATIVAKEDASVQLQLFHVGHHQMPIPARRSTILECTHI